MRVRCVLLLAACLGWQGAHAHDSWFAGPGRVVTGSRYPTGDLVVPAESIAASRCDDAGACWAELKAFDIELDAAIVERYFQEARPDEWVRARWSQLQAQGLPWRERYRKFVRSGRGTQPAGLDLEIVARPPQGGAARFVLLSKGRPVANQPIELRNDLSPIGSWSRTDANGQVEWTIPFAAQWLVRTILIEPDGESAWRSRFATLVFDVR